MPYQLALSLSLFSETCETQNRLDAHCRRTEKLLTRFRSAHSFYLVLLELSHRDLGAFSSYHDLPNRAHFLPFVSKFLLDRFSGAL